jgi:FSR family fosmidomycin resistance protein-like MFS transporter
MFAAGADPRVWSRVTSSALALGAVHALVDCTSGYLIFRDLGPSDLAYPTIVTLVVVYNTLAFGGQVPVGAATDRLQAYRGAAVLGALLVAASLAVSRYQVVAGVIVVGIGNALFHVGAGAHVLRVSGNRATESGVFVGPGAVGLVTGIWMGSQRVEARWAIVGLVAVGAVLLTWLVRQGGRSSALPELPGLRAGALLVALVCASLLVGSVAVRALVGGAISGTWRGVSVDVMLLLAVAACGGKMLGGFVSDRFGWATTSVFALLIAAPLVSAFVRTPVGAVLGMLVFQMTMPVTLKATHHLLPKRPGLAFGLPCLALLLGALPGLYHVEVFSHWAFVLLTVVLSAGLVGLGLRLLVRVGADGGPRPELVPGWRTAAG